MRHAEASHSLLTAAQEIALARRVHGDDDADAIRARDELVTHNYRLVAFIVRKVYRRRSGLDYEDLYSEAVVTLLRAATMFRPDLHPVPVRFSTYAAPAIFNALRNYTDSEGLVRVPHYVQDPAWVGRLMKRKHTSTGRKKLAANLEDARIAQRAMLSLSQPAALNESGDGFLMDRDIPADTQPAPLEALVHREEQSTAAAAFARLAPVKAHVLARRLGIGQAEPATLKEIGLEIGYCRERVRQIEVAALADLQSLALNEHI